jgi:hypothetical protein
MKLWIIICLICLIVTIIILFLGIESKLILEYKCKHILEYVNASVC